MELGVGILLAIVSFIVGISENAHKPQPDDWNPLWIAIHFGHYILPLVASVVYPNRWWQWGIAYSIPQSLVYLVIAHGPLWAVGVFAACLLSGISSLVGALLGWGRND